MDFNAKYAIGSVFVSLGVTFILNSENLITSFFWCFVAIFLFMMGLYGIIRAIIKEERRDLTSHFSTFFIGISIMLFVFSIISFSASILFSAIFASFGLAYVLSGCFFRYSNRYIIAGLILIGLSIILFLPAALNFSDRVYRTIRNYGLGLVFVAIGILIFLPFRGSPFRRRKSEADKKETPSDKKE
jgi:hypothetical protein